MELKEAKFRAPNLFFGIDNGKDNGMLFIPHTNYSISIPPPPWGVFGTFPKYFWKIYNFALSFV